jgi:hypothetical protein
MSHLMLRLFDAMLETGGIVVLSRKVGVNDSHTSISPVRDVLASASDSCYVRSLQCFGIVYCSRCCSCAKRPRRQLPKQRELTAPSHSIQLLMHPSMPTLSPLPARRAEQVLSLVKVRVFAPWWLGQLPTASASTPLSRRVFCSGKRCSPLTSTTPLLPGLRVLGPSSSSENFLVRDRFPPSPGLYHLPFHLRRSLWSQHSLHDSSTLSAIRSYYSSKHCQHDIRNQQDGHQRCHPQRDRSLRSEHQR